MYKRQEDQPRAESGEHIYIQTKRSPDIPPSQMHVSDQRPNMVEPWNLTTYVGGVCAIACQSWSPIATAIPLASQHAGSVLGTLIT